MEHIHKYLEIYPEATKVIMDHYDNLKTVHDVVTEWANTRTIVDFLVQLLCILEDKFFLDLYLETQCPFYQNDIDAAFEIAMFITRRFDMADLLLKHGIVSPSAYIHVLNTAKYAESFGDDQRFIVTGDDQRLLVAGFNIGFLVLDHLMDKNDIHPEYLEYREKFINGEFSQEEHDDTLEHREYFAKIHHNYREKLINGELQADKRGENINEDQEGENVHPHEMWEPCKAYLKRYNEMLNRIDCDPNEDEYQYNMLESDEKDN